MIIFYHQNNKVVEIKIDGKSIAFSERDIVKAMFEVAVSFPDKLLIWCHFDLQFNLNFSNIDTIFHHNKIMASYNISENFFLPDAIGYVEGSPFIKINKKVTYPTWRMSSSVGGIHASVLLQFENITKSSSGDFDYYLNSLAKLAMPYGLFCHSEPKLLIDDSVKRKNHKASLYILFRFVKQHYNKKWLFLLFINMIVYERKVLIAPFIFSLFYSKRQIQSSFFGKSEVQSKRKIFEDKSIDVIIPTIGRKKYLYDFLKDLTIQTHLPKNVIVIEQNPDQDSISELDYISNQIWPFKINHKFTHQAGACNARNLALAEVKSEWVFMADDDIRIENDFIENALKNMIHVGVFVGTYGCYAKDYPLHKKHPIEMQWTSFGSGCSIVKSEFLEDIKYNAGFEFGYGEDSDFGMQLRNKGIDVVYFPNPEIVHLKAPVGGFRIKPVLLWSNDSIQPKPSPTVMLYNQLHLTAKQINGYKMILFFKFYKVQTIKNPLRYLRNIQKQWKQSLYWANKLKNKE